MGRFSLVNHCPKSIVRNWLFRRHFPSPESVSGQADLCAAHHQLITGRTLHNIGFVGRPTDVATPRFLQLKRFIHATGFRNSTKRDYYEVLGVSKSASREDIKKAFHASTLPCSCAADGLGHPMNAKTKVCPMCKGIGKVTIPPFMATCSDCKGSGRIIKEYCMECKGSGMVEGVKKVKVMIPGGVDSGDTIRVPGAGNAGRRSQPGTLFIKIKVADNPIFRREGVDIYVDSNIRLTQAVLGGEVEVPTLSGKTKIKIPKGVQHGQLKILRGKGLQKSGFFVNHGDQYVCFRIKFPTVVSERQRSILEEFAKEEIEQADNMSADGNWLQRIREHFASPKFIFEFSVLMLILLLLNKILA